MDIFSKVKVDEALRPYVCLSTDKLAELIRECARSTDPADAMSKRLEEIGRNRRQAIEENKEVRKREDKAFFENYTRWPGSYCCVKEQPWLPGQTRRFGTVYLDEFQAGNFTVHVEGASTERFASLEALVEIWSVD